MHSAPFRSQVLEEQGQKAFGETLLRSPELLHWASYVLVAMAVVAASFLVFGEYHRKEQAPGVILPSKGLVKVYAPNRGTVAKVLVKEGQLVSQGAPLIVVTKEYRLDSGVDLSLAKLQESERLRESIEARLNELSERKSKEKAALQDEIASFEDSLRILRGRKELSVQRLKLKTERLSRIAPLIKDGTISKDDHQQATDLALQIRDRLSTDEQALIEAQRQKQALTVRLDSLDAIYHDMEGQLLSQLTSDKQQIADLDSNRTYTLSAAIDGKVAALQGYPGTMIDPGRPLLTIRPKDSLLEAHLFVPDRAIGFGRPGQKVSLQLNAFPFQKFGALAGSVIEVTSSVLQANEIPEIEMSSAAEPVYRVKVILDSQTMEAFGEAFVLQAGMRLNARIILDSRDFKDWLLEPFYRAGT